MKTINLAFVGTGGWASKFHFPALAFLQEHASDYKVNLCGITCLELDRAEQIASEYGFEQVYPDLDALLADERLDAVAVAISPGALKNVVSRIAARGLPLLSEKPPGESYAEACEIAELVTVPNVLAFNRRFNPLNNKFKAIVDDMQDIYFVEGHFFRHRRSDPTFMIGTGIHWINFMEYLFGPIVHVRSHRQRHPDGETWVRVAKLTFESGVPGLLKVFPCSGSEVEQVEVHSATLSAYLDGPMSHSAGSIRLERGRERELITPTAEQSTPDAVRIGIVGEYQAFFDLVLNGTPSRSTFQNGVNAMRVAEAMEWGYDF